MKIGLWIPVAGPFSMLRGASSVEFMFDVVAVPLVLQLILRLEVNVSKYGMLLNQCCSPEKPEDDDQQGYKRD